jgi:hypothetical protein
MSLGKRRKPAWGDRLSSEDQATTTQLDGLSLPPTAHWFPYMEDQFGDVVEPPEAALVSANRKAPHVCESCSGVSRYTRAA